MTSEHFKIQMGSFTCMAQMDAQTGTLRVFPRRLDQTRSPEKREYRSSRMAEAGDILTGGGMHTVLTKNINWQDDNFLVEVETWSSHQNYKQKFPVRYCHFYLRRAPVRGLPCIAVGG
jgi:hypothetical protein